MTSRACSTEYRLKHPCGKAAGVLCRICTVLVLLCRGGRLCPPCMTAAPCRAGPMCPAVTDVGICLSSPSSAREVSARSADGGRDATRFLSPSRLRRQPSPRGGLTARRRRADGTSRTPSPTHSTRPAANPPVKITTIPRRILCTYPKCENFAGNGCGWYSKVLYLTHTS